MLAYKTLLLHALSPSHSPVDRQQDRNRTGQTDGQDTLTCSPLLLSPMLTCSPISLPLSRLLHPLLPLSATTSDTHLPFSFTFLFALCLLCASAFAHMFFFSFSHAAHIAFLLLHSRTFSTFSQITLSLTNKWLVFFSPGSVLFPYGQALLLSVSHTVLHTFETGFLSCSRTHSELYTPFSDFSTACVVYSLTSLLFAILTSPLFIFLFGWWAWVDRLCVFFILLVFFSEGHLCNSVSSNLLLTPTPAYMPLPSNGGGFTHLSAFFSFCHHISFSLLPKKDWTNKFSPLACFAYYSLTFCQTFLTGHYFLTWDVFGSFCFLSFFRGVYHFLCFLFHACFY